MILNKDYKLPKIDKIDKKESFFKKIIKKIR